jgi:hypothetical protein
MSVWYCIPSARPPRQTEPVLRAWQERGYKTALWVDHFAHVPVCDRPHDVVMSGAYPGYAAAVNSLTREVLRFDISAEWLVTGGDDIYPDPNCTAEEIAMQCSQHFGSTFGVMQPTGDRWGDNEKHLGARGSAYIDRVAGSPWMGSEFCRRMYQGNGPLYEGYFHMGEDEELQAIATKLGVLWQRPDLTHYHDHCLRARADAADRPAFLERAYSAVEWKKYKQLFAERQAAGFPGHEPLEV